MRNELNLLEQAVIESARNLTQEDIYGLAIQADHQGLRSVSEPLACWVLAVLNDELERRKLGEFVPTVLCLADMNDADVGKCLHAAAVLVDAQTTDTALDFVIDILRLVAPCASSRLSVRHIALSN